LAATLDIEYSIVEKSILSRLHAQFTVVLSGVEAMPLSTTASELAPVSAVAGTSNNVETIVLPVATPMLLRSCVRA
jgi:hypothetical protein